jgi:hypothetical protein
VPYCIKRLCDVLERRREVLFSYVPLIISVILCTVSISSDKNESVVLG